MSLRTQRMVSMTLTTASITSTKVGKHTVAIAGKCEVYLSFPHV